MSATTLVYKKTYTIPEFKAATDSKSINFHQTESGKLFFTTDKLSDDCKVSNKLSVIDIQSEPDKLRVSEVHDSETGKDFFMIHFRKDDDQKPIMFTL